MDIDPLLDDIARLIADAPLVERTEWCRQAIRRLEAASLIIRLLAECVHELEQRQTA